MCTDVWWFRQLLSLSTMSDNQIGRLHVYTKAWPNVGDRLIIEPDLNPVLSSAQMSWTIYRSKICLSSQNIREIALETFRSIQRCDGDWTSEWQTSKAKQLFHIVLTCVMIWKSSQTGSNVMVPYLFLQPLPTKRICYLILPIRLIFKQLSVLNFYKWVVNCIKDIWLLNFYCSKYNQN